MNITKENALQYSELLKAYAEGKTIQMCSDWGGTDWTTLENPKFGANIKYYQVKPEMKTIKYRLYWWKIIHYGAGKIELEPETITEEQYNRHVGFENIEYFGGWISDWLEIEVPEIKE